MASDGYRPRPRIPDGEKYPQGASPPLVNRLHIQAWQDWHRNRYGDDTDKQTVTKMFTMPNSGSGRTASAIAITLIGALIALATYLLVLRLLAG